MDKIAWCKKKKGGLTLTEPSPNISAAYIKKAEEALESMSLLKDRDWRISTAYYAMYFSLYSVLMRIGVKCEIHSCTISFAKNFLTEYLTDEDIEMLEESLKARIDAQYYVDRAVEDGQYKAMTDNAPGFLVKCKSLVLTEKKIDEIRKKLGGST